MAIVLVISRPDKPEVRQEISLDGKKMILGHSVYCDVKLDDKLVGSMQCEVLTAKSGHIVINNLDQKREVYINQTRLKRSSLKSSDILKIGPFIITIDPDKLTQDELAVINTEWIEYC
ncbi:MAG: FHA domain-containing protein [Bacteriovorax sp.]|jgi:hypothetical protein